MVIILYLNACSSAVSVGAFIGNAGTSSKGIKKSFSDTYIKTKILAKISLLDIKNICYKLDLYYINQWKQSGRSIQIMSDNNLDTDGEVLTKTKPKTSRPPMYKVILLNDDFTPMEFVVHILEKFFSINHDMAINIMLTVHQKGLAVIGVFSHDVAESKVNQVMTYSRQNQHPLQCTMEKE